MATGLVHSTTLTELGADLGFETSGNAQISGLTHDSRLVQPGDLYLAIPGLQKHGIEFLSDAVSAGATVIASDAYGCQIAQEHNIPTLLLENPRIDMAKIAAHLYGHPERQLRIVGVTGTNGKTTVTQMLRHALTSAGLKVGVIGTLGTFIGDEQLPNSRTTPESTDLFKILALMVSRSVDIVCMEVSSHALELERVAGIRFDVAIFTNLTQDHLDFHETMDEYFVAKQKLFIGGRSKTAVINSNDSWGKKLLATTDAENVISVGQEGQWQIKEAATDLIGNTTFNLTGPHTECFVEIPIYGLFNAENAALCLAACANLGLEPAEVSCTLQSLPQVAGRMQVIANFNGATALVDYAHTPDAVEKSLSEIRNANPKELIVVLGCGGNRDATKRPIMGSVAAEFADVVIVTDDNPRFELPSQIRAEILGGISQTDAEVVEIGNRRLAIREAVKRATPGSVIAVLGKGHELGQEIAGVVHEFDDSAEILKAVADV